MANGLVGAVVALVKGLVLAAVVLMVISAFLGPETPFFKESATWPYMRRLSVQIREWVPADLRQALEYKSGLLPDDLPLLPPADGKDSPWKPALPAPDPAGFAGLARQSGKLIMPETNERRWRVCAGYWTGCWTRTPVVPGTQADHGHPAPLLMEDLRAARTPSNRMTPPASARKWATASSTSSSWPGSTKGGACFEIDDAMKDRRDR